MKKSILISTLIIFSLQILVNAVPVFCSENNYTYYMQNYDFSAMNMKNGEVMGIVKFPDTQNPNAWGFHGSANPKSVTYKSSNATNYMDIINDGSTKSGTCYFWNNFPKVITEQAYVEFNLRSTKGSTNIYLMSDSKFDGDETASNVPTDWPNVAMNLIYDASSKSIKFGQYTVLSNVVTTDWCNIKIEANVKTKKLNITASQLGRQNTIADIGFTATDKSNISILSFCPSKSSQIDVTGITMGYVYSGVEPDTTPTPNPIGQVIYHETDESLLKETENLIAQKPNMYSQMEKLSRGLTAVNMNNGVFLSWRLLGDEDYDIAFNIYKNELKLNDVPISNSTNFVDQNGELTDIYKVAAVVGDKEIDISEPSTVLRDNYRSIPMNIPQKATTPAGEEYTYTAGDCSVGDVNGDGEYELIVKWDPSNLKDNSHDGYTGNVYIDAYTLSGKQLWRIDLGKNIRAGAHYTQFMVYDLDGNGVAELVCKTSDGTVDGIGNVIGNEFADYRNSNGRIITGNEYLTVFDGTTGAARYTENFSPLRNDLGDYLYKIWGDYVGNRSDRFLACIAYLDGVHPSLIMVRGYYTRTVLTAYNFKDNKLEQVWKFDTSTNASKDFIGKGNHNLSVGDIDYDGYDEIVFGSALIDHNGVGIDAGLGHGDAMHFGDLDPSRPGLEVFQVHENTEGYVNVQLRDARTNKMIWGVPYRKDIGRGVTADIDPNYVGEECLANGVLYSAKGEVIGSSTNLPANFAIWWDGDILREMADSNKITKYDYSTKTSYNIFTADGCTSNNGTKSNPCIQADLFGDWREEIAFRTEDSSEIRIFTTTDRTEIKLYTLMHDRVYREGVAWQNVAYNQPPHTSFFLGEDMAKPEKPNIYFCDTNIINTINDIKLGETNTVLVSVLSDVKGKLVCVGLNNMGEIQSIDIENVEQSGKYEMKLENKGVSGVKIFLISDFDSLTPLGKSLKIQ